MSYRVDRQGFPANETEWFESIEAAEERVRQLNLTGTTSAVAWHDMESTGPFVQPTEETAA